MYRGAAAWCSGNNPKVTQMAKAKQQQPTAPAQQPAAPAPVQYITMGARQYKPRVTDLSKHAVMGDVVMFTKIQKALADDPAGRITVAAALALVKSVNPKNGAYLGYAVRHNWLALVQE